MAPLHQGGAELRVVGRRMLAVAALASVAVAASSALGANAVAADPHTVNVELTAAGCPAKLVAPSGPTTFFLANTGAKAVDEFELLNGKGEVVGEVESLTIGSRGSFVVALDPGTYVTYCPGGKRERGRLVVTGEPVPQLGPQSQRTVDAYRAYVLEQAGQLVATTTIFADAVKRGDVAAAKAAYPAARIPYERIEP